MLLVDRISRRYGPRAVLHDVSFTLGEGSKAAAVGPNGCGKSTLARIVAGLEQPDSGTVGGSFAGRPELYLPQGRFDPGDAPAWEAVPSIAALWRRGHALTADSPPEDANLAAQLEEFEDAGGWPAFGALRERFGALGIADLRPDAPYATLSGGERARLGLAALPLRDAPFLLLDEPTNHLDAGALAWLEGALQEYRGALLLISHDRTLIDAVADQVLAFDGDSGTLRSYAGGYTAYGEAVERERETQLDTYKRQEAERERIEEDIRRVKQRAARFDTASANDHWRRIGKKVAKLAKSRERKLEKALASDERVERPKRAWSMNAAIATAERAGDIVCEADGVWVSFDGNPVLRDVSLVVRWGERVVLTGPNGSGKTTLLRVLLGEQPPDRGNVRLGASVRAAYLSQQGEGLDPASSPLATVRAATAMTEGEARGYLHRFLFSGDEVFTPVASLSFGQRSRLALARLILGGTNLLVLDEPLNHLDIPSRERFEEALAAFSGTILTVSHDRRFIERLATRVLAIEAGALREVDVLV